MNEPIQRFMIKCMVAMLLVSCLAGCNKQEQSYMSDQEILERYYSHQRFEDGAMGWKILDVIGPEGPYVLSDDMPIQSNPGRRMTYHVTNGSERISEEYYPLFKESFFLSVPVVNKGGQNAAIILRTVKHVEDAKISSFEIKDLTLPEAILELNKQIREEHPGQKHLLVGYVDMPWDAYRDLELEKALGGGAEMLGGDDGRRRKGSLSVSSPETIQILVHYLCNLYMAHFGIHDGTLVIYDWHLPTIDEPYDFADEE